MGLDFGAATLGVAVSDALLITAQGLLVIRRKHENKLRQTLSQLEALIAEYQIEKIVLGYPKHLDNSIGERAVKSQEFAAVLERRTGLPVILWDERLTTVAAHRVLNEASVHETKQAKVVDKIAAALILQGYLDYSHMRKQQNIEGQSALEV